MAYLETLDINFGTERRAIKPLGLTLLAAGIVAAALVAEQMATVHHALMDRRIAYKKMEDRIGAAGAERQRRNRTTPGEMQRYRNAATVAASLATPWEALLETLERAPTQNVALLSIEPVASERLLRLAAEAKDLYAMLDYLAYLQGAPGLHHAILVSHQVQTQQPGSPVKFQIQAQWGAQGDAP